MHTVLQVSGALKDSVPDHVKEKAREMARQELQRRLEELNMSASDAQGYGELLAATQTHMLSLHDLLESKAYQYVIMRHTNSVPLTYFRPRCERGRTSLGEEADGWRVR